jgi:hypothetical protein
MPIIRKAPENPSSVEFEVITRVTVEGGARVVVKITTEAIAGRGRAACIAMAAAKIRGATGKPPAEVIVAMSDFR